MGTFSMSTVMILQSVVPVLCKFAKTTKQANQSAYKYLHSEEI